MRKLHVASWVGGRPWVYPRLIAANYRTYRRMAWWRGLTPADRAFWAELAPAGSTARRLSDLPDRSEIGETSAAREVVWPAPFGSGERGSV